MNLTPYEEKVVEAAFDLMNVPYVWNGKDSSGLDCSGFYNLAVFLGSAGQVDHRHTYNTDLMLAKFRPITGPELRPGCAILYGKNAASPKDANHVMMFVSPELCIGACGGDSTTTTTAIAARRDARVKAKFFYRYRWDQILGFRALPVPATPE